MELLVKLIMLVALASTSWHTIYAMIEAHGNNKTSPLLFLTGMLSTSVFFLSIIVLLEL